jgi:hypothetical protein
LLPRGTADFRFDEGLKVGVIMRFGTRDEERERESQYLALEDVTEPAKVDENNVPAVEKV